MPGESGLLREIAWRELFPWLNIARAARLAVAPRLLLLAALGLFLTALGWQGLGWAYSQSTDPKLTDWREQDRQWRWETPVVHDGAVVVPGKLVTAAPVAPFSPSAATETNPAVSLSNASLFAESASPFFWLSRPFFRLFDRTASLLACTYALACGIWALAVWAFVGGAITRTVGLSLANEGRLSAVEAGKFAAMKWPAFFSAPMLSLLGVLVLGIVVGGLFGLVMRADVGVLLAAIAWPLMLAACFVMAILLLGLLFGWPLMWPTISVEGTDSFDALSRSYSYTFQRPLHYLFYAVVAAIIGTLASLVVLGLAGAVAHLSYWAATWGAGSERIGQVFNDAHVAQGAGGVYGAGVAIIGYWHSLVLLLGAAYLYSYFWAAATAIYFLLRRHVDGAEMDEIWSEPREETYGLPPLRDDPSGVPQVADVEVKS